MIQVKVVSRRHLGRRRPCNGFIGKEGMPAVSFERLLRTNPTGHFFGDLAADSGDSKSRFHSPLLFQDGDTDYRSHWKLLLPSRLCRLVCRQILRDTLSMMVNGGAVEYTSALPAMIRARSCCLCDAFRIPVVAPLNTPRYAFAFCMLIRATKLCTVVFGCP